MSLKEYRRKRKFDRTPEPEPKSGDTKKKKTAALRFVVQKHAATRTHYDFRLEFDGSLKSWAVPKGPSLTSQDPRLAVFVEDHPLEYGSFEGTIPKGNYGAGTVMIWDAGTFTERSSTGRTDSEAALLKGMAKGHLTFVLEGEKLRGEFALVKIKNKRAEEKAWLLVKKHDAWATREDILLRDTSVVTGRTLEQIAKQAEAKGEIWIPGKGRKKKSKATAKPKLVKKKIPVKNIETPKLEMPHRVRVMEPVFVSANAAPEGAGWFFEIFGAGYRAVAEVGQGRTRLYSRALMPFEKKYPAIAEALERLPGSLVVEGEIVGLGSDREFLISDLLFQDGEDLRGLALSERRKHLAKLPLRPPLRHATWTTTLNSLKIPPGAANVVAKRADSIYRNEKRLTKEWVRFRPLPGVREKPRPGKIAAIPAPAKKRVAPLPKREPGRPAPTTDTPPLTHPEKIYFPDDGFTKRDLYEYYDRISPTILPYLIDRPQSLHRQPDGIKSAGFFHKDMSGFMPRRIQSERVFSESAARTINYVLCQDRWSLLYLANLGCIELNPWLSRRGKLENPDFVVIDLDPDDNDFDEVVKVARETHRVLEAVGAESFCKTSGATGLHICIPTQGKYDFDVGRLFAEAVCGVVHRKFPNFTSVERNPAKRRGKIYLDFLQNRRAQTLAAPYCVRPRPGATVSTPLKWSEVKIGLRPEAFTIQTIERRLRRTGDLWLPMLEVSVDIEKSMKRLSKNFHI